MTSIRLSEENGEASPSPSSVIPPTPGGVCKRWVILPFQTASPLVLPVNMYGGVCTCQVALRFDKAAFTTVPRLRTSLLLDRRELFASVPHPPSTGTRGSDEINWAKWGPGTDAQIQPAPRISKRRIVRIQESGNIYATTSSCQSCSIPIPILTSLQASLHNGNDYGARAQRNQRPVQFRDGAAGRTAPGRGSRRNTRQRHLPYRSVMRRRDPACVCARRLRPRRYPS